MINCGDSGDQGGDGEGDGDGDSGGGGDGVRAGGGDGSGGDGGGDQENISPASSSIKVSSSSRTFGAELEQEFADLEIPRLCLARAAPMLLSSPQVSTSWAENISGSSPSETAQGTLPCVF